MLVPEVGRVYSQDGRGRKMRLILITLFFVALVPVSSSGRAEEAAPLPRKAGKLVGTYECTGVSPGENKEKYSLSLSVKQRGDHYDLEWSGKSSQIALGILTGDVLSVSILTLKGDKDGAIMVFPGGVGAYVANGGMLNGKWAIGDGKVYTETCTPSNSIAL